MIFLVLVHFCEPSLSIPFYITAVHLQQSSLQAKEVLTCFPGVCVLFEYLRRQICTLSSAKLERSGLISSCYLQVDLGMGPNNPTQPARKKPDPTRPELRGGWARAVFFDPQQSTGRARAVIFDPKPDPTRKTRPKGQKTRPNPKKTRPDTPAQGARANPTRPGDRYGSGAGRPMRPVTRP